MAIFYWFYQNLAECIIVGTRGPHFRRIRDDHCWQGFKRPGERQIDRREFFRCRELQGSIVWGWLVQGTCLGWISNHHPQTQIEGNPKCGRNVNAYFWGGTRICANREWAVAKIELEEPQNIFAHEQETVLPLKKIAGYFSPRNAQRCLLPRR